MSDVHCVSKINIDKVPYSVYVCVCVCACVRVCVCTGHWLGEQRLATSCFLWPRWKNWTASMRAVSMQLWVCTLRQCELNIHPHLVNNYIVVLKSLLISLANHRTVHLKLILCHQPFTEFVCEHVCCHFECWAIICQHEHQNHLHVPGGPLTFIHCSLNDKERTSSAFVWTELLSRTDPSAHMSARVTSPQVSYKDS